MSATIPAYVPHGNELDVFLAAHADRVPLMLIGPTGSGKTRFVEHMAAVLGLRLVTVMCHDDLTTADLVGRYLPQGANASWVDGPLTRSLRQGAICYLDEVVESRRDTLAVLHSLCDHRRTLYVDRTGKELRAPAEFMLVCSYNPRPRGALKELKTSFRQRFITVGFEYLEPEAETVVVAAEAGIATDIAAQLVAHAAVLRHLASEENGEPPSTRLLIVTAGLIKQGLSVADAVEVGLLGPLGVPLSEDHAFRGLSPANG